MDEYDNTSCSYDDDDKKLESYKEIRAVASKNWLNSAYVSLAKLDEVKAKVYNVGLSDARQLKAKPITKVISKHQLQMKPPITSVMSQRTAWGSSSSIPELVRQQSEKQRPESAKLLRPSRPTSVKRRPESAKTPLSQHKNMKNKIIMAVKGGRYEPNSRPPQTNPHLIDQPSGDHFNRAINMNFEQNAEKEPPPAPCASPDEMTTNGIMTDFVNQDSDDSDVNSEAIEERVRNNRAHQHKHKSPTTTLLRKPVQDPIHLTLPHASLDDEDADNIDTERLLEAAEGTGLQTKPGFSYVHAVSTKTTPKIHIPGMNIFWQIEEEQLGVINDDDDDDGDSCFEDFEDVHESKKEHKVKFDVDNESPATRATTYLHSGRPDLRNVKSRTDSGLGSVKTRPASAQKYSRPCSAKSDTTSTGSRSRPQSAKVQFVPTAVMVAYSDDDENGDVKNQAETERRKKKSRKSLRESIDDVDTLVRGYSVGTVNSDDVGEGSTDQNGGNSSRRRFLSEPERNYYEIAMMQNAAGADDNESSSSSKMKTVKTIEFVDGEVKETTEINTLDCHDVRSKPTARPLSGNIHKELLKPIEELWDKNGRRIKKIEEENTCKKRPKSASLAKIGTANKLENSPYQKPVGCIHSYAPPIRRPRSAHIGGKPQKPKHAANRPASAGDVKPHNKLRVNKKTQNEKPPKKILYIETRDRDDIIRSNQSEGMRQCKSMHFKLLEKGMDIPVDTLARALLPPQGTSVYLDSNAAQALPSNYSSGLLSSPAVWLSKEFRRLKLAEKALQRAEERLYLQRKNEEKLAKGEPVTKKKTKKKSTSKTQQATIKSIAV
ncbi:uncharacterized protein LOC141908325 [Tubulanus polymorphus]|uniref:uncharacterized protein LOC141908325 n=1 Tax=Tubulanus polymorphus TaxID=672921 RepID=UPI003DA4E3CE